MAGGSHSSRWAAWLPAWIRFEYSVAKCAERLSAERTSKLSSFVYQGTHMKQAAPSTIDEYIAGFPPDIQEMLQNVRAAIKEAQPDAQETISYNMPTFTLHGQYLVYFGAYKKHIGMYPVPAGDAAFNAEVSAYVAGKGTARFPFNRPIPFDLIRKIVKLRTRENAARATASTKKK